MTDTAALLLRIADALDRIAPPPSPLPDAAKGNVLVWQAGRRALHPVASPRRVPLDLILGADSQKERLLANIERFARGLPANHAMLWGARGTGKSALVKAVHARVAAAHPELKLIEVSRAEVASVTALAERLEEAGWRAILFIDDLSFERGDDGYKALKSVLDGGVCGALSDILVCVTSNRRHIINRPGGDEGDMRPDETMEEQVALSDRFGLWLGFHGLDQPTWLGIVRAYAHALDLAPDDPGLERAALQWSAQRGGRSGRGAWQFIVERAGALGKPARFADDAV